MNSLTQTEQTVNADTRFWGGRRRRKQCDLLDQASEWGTEDGLAGEAHNGATLYGDVNSPAYQCYNYAYLAAAGQRQWAQTAPVVDEATAMDATLADLRDGTMPLATEGWAPDGDERIGEEEYFNRMIR